MEESNPWKSITVPTSVGEINSLRVDGHKKHSFWWTVDSDGRPGLAVDFIDELQSTPSIPNFSIIEAIIVPNKKALHLTLLDKEIIKKFRVLCHDVITDTQDVEDKNDKQLLENLLSSLTRWQKLFEIKKIKAPTQSQKLGILGELCCLVHFVAAKTNFRHAVDAWQGPKGHEQDFSVNGHLIEVKTQLSSSDKIVKISSLEQLDTISGPIWLKHIGVSPADRLSVDTISINSLINTVVTGLKGDNFGTDIFVTLLEHIGFSVENEFGDEQFTIPFQNIYQVQKDFPCITKEMVGSSAIIKASYSINMSELTPWMVETDVAKQEIFN